MTTQKKMRPAAATAKRTRAAKTATSGPASAASVASAGRRRRRAAVTPDPRRVAERAYYLSLAGGADPVTNWLQAERELAAAA